VRSAALRRREPSEEALKRAEGRESPGGAEEPEEGPPR